MAIKRGGLGTPLCLILRIWSYMALGIPYFGFERSTVSVLFPSSNTFYVYLGTCDLV